MCFSILGNVTDSTMGWGEMVLIGSAMSEASTALDFQVTGHWGVLLTDLNCTHLWAYVLPSVLHSSYFRHCISFHQHISLFLTSMSLTFLFATVLVMSIFPVKHNKLSPLPGILLPLHQWSHSPLRLFLFPSIEWYNDKSAEYLLLK